MSDDNTATKNYYKRIAQELAEFDTPQARYQAVLDRHWESMRERDEPDDQYFAGGFQEFHSKTPSFHKSKRDRDLAHQVTNRYWPRQFDELEGDRTPVTWINEPLPPDNVATVVPRQRSIHART